MQPSRCRDRPNKLDQTITVQQSHLEVFASHYLASARLIPKLESAELINTEDAQVLALFCNFVMQRIYLLWDFPSYRRKQDMNRFCTLRASMLIYHVF